MKCEECKQKPEKCESCANKILHDAGFRLDGSLVGGARRKQLRVVGLNDPSAMSAQALQFLT